MTSNIIEQGRDLDRKFSEMFLKIENEVGPQSSGKMYHSRLYDDFRRSSLLAQFLIVDMYELSIESKILGIEYSFDVDEFMKSNGVIAKIALSMKDGDERKLCRILIVHKKFEQVSPTARKKLSNGEGTALATAKYWEAIDELSEGRPIQVLGIMKESHMERPNVRINTSLAGEKGGRMYRTRIIKSNDYNKDDEEPK